MWGITGHQLPFALSRFRFRSKFYSTFTHHTVGSSRAGRCTTQTVACNVCCAVCALTNSPVCSCPCNWHHLPAPRNMLPDIRHSQPCGRGANSFFFLSPPDRYARVCNVVHSHNAHKQGVRQVLLREGLRGTALSMKFLCRNEYYWHWYTRQYNSRIGTCAVDSQ